MSFFSAILWVALIFGAMDLLGNLLCGSDTNKTDEEREAARKEYEDYKKRVREREERYRREEERKRNEQTKKHTRYSKSSQSRKKEFEEADSYYDKHGNEHIIDYDGYCEECDDYHW